MTVLRELRLDDEADFRVLMACIDALYAELAGPSRVPDDALWARLRQQIADGPNPPYWAFVARDAAPEPLAFAMLGEAFAVFGRGRYGILTELWVRPDARGAGIGADVIAFVRRFARERGWYRVDVSAPPDARWDRTVAFYRRQGFEISGRKLKLRVEG